MNAAWLDGLQRARATVKHPYVAIHVAAKLRDSDGVAPVVLQTEEGYLRAPAMLEAAFELCLRHLHGRRTPLNCQSITAQALLANRAVEALRLPGRYVPTSEGEMIDMQAGAPACGHAGKEDDEAGAPEVEEATGSAGAEADTPGTNNAEPGHIDNEIDAPGAPEVEAPGSAVDEADTRGTSNAEPGHVDNEIDTPGDAPEVEEAPGHAVHEVDAPGVAPAEATMPGDAPEVEEAPGSEGLEVEATMPDDASEVDEAGSSEHQTIEAAAGSPRAEEASTWRDRRRIKRAERRRVKKRRR